MRSFLAPLAFWWRRKGSHQEKAYPPKFSIHSLGCYEPKEDVKTLAGEMLCSTKYNGPSLTKNAIDWPVNNLTFSEFTYLTSRSVQWFFLKRHFGIEYMYVCAIAVFKRVVTCLNTQLKDTVMWVSPSVLCWDFPVIVHCDLLPPWAFCGPSCCAITGGSVTGQQITLSPTHSPVTMVWHF